MSFQTIHYIVTGDKEHGKDYVCEYLRDVHGIDFRGSSWMFCKHVFFDRIKDDFGYATIDECYVDRRNHRKLWYDAIKAFNGNEPAKLADLVFSEAPVYCGLRSRWEFEGIKRKYQVKTIWVDASERLPGEDPDSMDLTIDDADIVVDNNGPKGEVHPELDRLAQQMKADIGML